MLNENEIQLASLAVREIRVAVAHSLLHPFGSPPVRRAIEKAFHCLRELLLLRPRITLDFEGERPRVEQSDLEEGVVDSTHVLNEILQSHGIKKVTFTQGLTADELTGFFALLKPRFLPDEKTALQSIQENPIRNVGVNELEPLPSPVPPEAPKQEPAARSSEPIPAEKPAPPSPPPGPASITFDVSGPITVTPETEDEIRYQEAEEALERFLEIASEIDSDHHRDDLVRRLSGLTGNPNDHPEKDVSPPTLGWKALMDEFMEFRNEFTNGSKPQKRLDGLLHKLSETYRVAPPAPKAEAETARPSAGREEAPVNGGSVAENPSQLLNPAREAESDAALRAFLEGHRVERIIPAWVVLWNGVFSGAESIQALCLRHLSRLDWSRLPPPLQMEGFSYLDNFLRAHWAENLRLEAMDRLEAWLKIEKEQGHWEVLLPRAETARSLAMDHATPAILRTRAMAFLKNLYPREVFDSYYQRLGAPGDEQARGIFRSAGPLASAFLREHLAALDPETIDADEAAHLSALLGELESVGEKPLDRLLDRIPGERGARILLGLSRFMPFPVALAEPLRSQLAQYSLEIRRKALDLVESGGRKDLHGWAVELLGDADLDLVRRALKLLGNLRIGGASRYVVTMLETREFSHKDARDSFWAEACLALGDMADPMSIKPLTEWAQSYSLLEKRKEKSLVIRRAAIQALGRFRSNQVKTFLEKLIDEGDDSVIDVVSEAHEQVLSRLEQPSDKMEPVL